MNLVALKNELTSGHPATGPYSADDVTAADELNAPNRTPNRDALTGGELGASLVRSELALLTPADQNYVRALITCQSIPLTQNFRNEIQVVFPVGSTTRANVIALLKRSGSRAEELGFGFVTPSNVADARRA